MFNRLKKPLLIILLLFLIANFSYRIELSKTTHELLGELMYFPSGLAIKALSMGFYVPLGDLVWLRFIQYYGEHRMTDARFDLMYHILDIITTLDPNFLHAYTLGSLMLTHDAKRVDQGEALLKKGMENNQNEWRLPFIYGFINYVFLGNYNVAQAYFRLSAQTPTAGDMAKRWAGYVSLKKLHDLKEALSLWLDLYHSTKSPEEKALAEMYIKDIVMQLDIQFLDQKIEEYTNRFGQRPLFLKELVTYGLLDSMPNEPHGGKYFIKGGSASSTWQIHTN